MTDEFLAEAMDDNDAMVYAQELAEEQELQGYYAALQLQQEQLAELLLQQEQLLQAAEQLAQEQEQTVPIQNNSVNEEAAEGNLPEIGKLVENMKSESVRVQFAATAWARRILIKYKSRCQECQLKKVQDIIAAGLVTASCELLNSDDTQLQFEAASVLALILETKETIPPQQIWSTIPALFRLLDSPLNFIVDRAAQVLGYIGAISSEFRRYLLLEVKVLVPLLPLVKVKTIENLDLIRTIAWLTNQLSESKDEDQESFMAAVAECLPTLERLIMVDDPLVLHYASCAVNGLFEPPDSDADGNGDTSQRRKAAIGSGLIPRIVDLLGSNDINIIGPCLCTVKDIITGSESQFEYMVRAKVLPYLRKVIMNDPPHGSLRLLRIAVSIVIDICSSTMGAVQGKLELLFHENLIPALISTLKIDDSDIRKGSAWILAGIIRICKRQHALDLIGQGFVEAACSLLFLQTDWISVEGALKGLELILQVSTAGTVESNTVISRIKDCRADVQIQALRNFGTDRSIEAAKNISDKYFNSQCKNDFGDKVEQK